MVVYYDPAKGQTIDTEQTASQQLTAPLGLDPIGRQKWAVENQVKQQNAQLEQAAAEGRNKPFFAQDGGQFMDDLGNILGDTATGLVTDYLDLGAGLADAAVQAGSALTGNGWNWDKVFDDSDNPWTQWRQQEFGTQTEAGAVVANVSRLASMVITLPKLGIKGLIMAPKALSNLPKIGKAFDGTVDVLEGLDKAVKASRNAKVTEAITDVGKGFAAGSAGSKAAKIAGADDWLSATFKEVSTVGEAKSWWQSVGDSTKALTQLTREKAKFRTVSEAVAWDAFAAFNVYGEGDWEMDETLNDTLREAGLPNLPWLETSVQDAPLTRKFKQMTEGLAMAGVLNAAFDMSRVFRYSRAFSKATPTEQEALIKAFNGEADEIGRGLAGLLPAQAMPHPDIAMAAAKEARLDQLKLGVNTARIGQQYQKDLDVAQLMANQQMANEAAGVLPPEQLPTGPWDPNRPDQPIAGLLPGTRGPRPVADPNSSVQNRLAQMEGAASPLDEDPLYQEWLASKAPAGAFMPPSPGGNPQLEQFAARGPMPEVGGPPSPDDLQQYRAWLEAKARLPEAELDPRVQQSLRRLEGVGELATVQRPAAGELVPGGIEPVQVQEIGPRPPEPTVTPDTIRNAFQQDAFRAFKQSQELTFQEGPDGVMRSVADLRRSVRELMPRTRVDSIEYLTKFTPQANELGVVNASDSVWMNFITNRGLAEGWASIDPDTMQVRFNRKAAFEIDRGDVAAKQAEAFDQLSELELFKQRYADQVAGIEGQKQELLGQMDQVKEEAGYQNWLAGREPMNPGSLRPEVQDNLAQKEAKDAYDQWEAAQQADPAKADLERQAITAGVEEQQLLASEELRLSQAELDRAVGQVDDATVVREYLGTTLDSIQRPEVQKVEVGRGWEVIGADGEVIGSTSTKRAAEKMADAEQRRLTESTIARARQMEADGADQAVNLAIGNPIYDSDVVGKVALTDRQIEAVQRYSQAIQRQMNADWEKRTGGQAFININDLGGSKKTFEMTQGEMFDLVDGIKALLQTGEITGARAKVLKNVADKLDTSMKLLAPEARAKRFADGIAADAQRFLEHGDFC